MAALSGVHPLALPARRPLASFLQGAALPFQALGFLLARPRLWPLAVLPLLLNTVLFCALLYWGGGWLAGQLQEALQGGSDGAWYVRWPLETLRVLAGLLFWGVVLLGVYFVFTPAALVLAGPFNDRLAEHVEAACGFALSDTRPFVRAVLGEAIFAVGIEARRFALFALVFVLLLPLNLLPVLGSAAYVVLTFLWTCLATVLQFTSYASDRRHWSVRRWVRLPRAHPALCLGFACPTLLLLLIPFLNILVVPVSAIAGTLLFGMTLDRRGEDAAGR